VVRLPLSPLGCQLDGLISLTATKRRSSWSQPIWI
jgi:hypothetical protein